MEKKNDRLCLNAGIKISPGLRAFIRITERVISRKNERATIVFFKDISTIPSRCFMSNAHKR
jgi:hypothetical protein